MANITVQEPIRWKIDKLDTTVQLMGRVLIPPAQGLDFTLASSVTGLSATGTVPAGTQARYVFGVGNTWYKVNPNGTLAQVTDTSAEGILAGGNAFAEFPLTVQIPSFVGQMVGVGIALESDEEGVVFPEVSVQGSMTSITQVTQKVLLSPEYNVMADRNLVFGVLIDKQVSNAGAVIIEAKTTDTDGNASNWTLLATGNELDALAISKAQFRATLQAPTPGTDVAKLSNIKLITANTLVDEEGGAALYTQTFDVNHEIGQVKFHLYHSNPNGSPISAWVALRTDALYQTNEAIGNGTGSPQTYPLAHEGVRGNSIQVFVNGNRRYDFTYETAEGEASVTLSAPNGAGITASYEYNWGIEEFAEMTQISQTTGDLWHTTFTYTNLEAGLGVICVKTLSNQATTQYNNYALGMGNGHVMAFVLPQAVQDGTLTVKLDGIALDSSSYELDTTKKILTVNTINNQAVNATFTGISDPLTVSRFVLAVE
ncbi:hypothetical protein FACS1894216_01350 [Synergistales bacterium]|nr:hypothetical protein FACS1894216_01350 [Synergistales bacterium]